MNSVLSILPVSSKECSGCHTVKPLCEFSPHKKSRDLVQPKCRSCRRTAVNDYNRTELGRVANRQPNRIFGHYVQRSKRRGILFNLTFHEFMKLWQMPCSYCSSPISTIGIDRVDNERGYSLDNVVSCCIVCNRMKLTSNRDEFIEQCRRIVLTADISLSEDR
jgi:hypothetical protein